MSITKKDIINQILSGKTPKIRNQVSAFAPSNIALCKYWGKRNIELNLPHNSSLSISLKDLGTSTKLSLNDRDQVVLNSKPIDSTSSFYIKLKEFLDLFRTEKNYHFKIETQNNIPTAAGLASSASGICALVKCLNELFSYNLNSTQLSIVARLGSGSACRSFWNGFVYWEKGQRDDGMDSYSYPLKYSWEDLRIGILEISASEKNTPSRDGMNRTVSTSPFYPAWVKSANEDIIKIEEAIKDKDFNEFGELVEANALRMHASMLGARPGLVYFLPETLGEINKIWQLRQQGLDLYFTADAGANLKLIFLKNTELIIKKHFSNLQIIKPF